MNIKLEVCGVRRNKILSLYTTSAFFHLLFLSHFIFLYCQRFSFNRVWNIFVEVSSVAVAWLIFHVELIFMMGQSFHLLNAKLKVIKTNIHWMVTAPRMQNAGSWLSFLCFVHFGSIVHNIDLWFSVISEVIYTKNPLYCSDCD